MVIYLIGFMGTGKSYWGEIWAKEINFPFYDLDAVIEQSARKTISEIFEANGEAGFRRTEAQTLRRLPGSNDAIIACGGGTPCFHENMQWMNENGNTVYLQSTIGQLIQRLGASAQRPLLQNQSPEDQFHFIERKLAERMPFYRQANVTVDTSTLSKQSIHQIINNLNATARTK